MFCVQGFARVITLREIITRITKYHSCYTTIRNFQNDQRIFAESLKRILNIGKIQTIKLLQNVKMNYFYVHGKG